MSQRVGEICLHFFVFGFVGSNLLLLAVADEEFERARVEGPIAIEGCNRSWSTSTEIASEE